MPDKKEKKKVDKVDQPTSFKLSPEAKRLLRLLSEKNLRSQAKTLEHLIIEAARLQSIT